MENNLDQGSKEGPYDKYYENTKGEGPRESLGIALVYVSCKDIALDLGAGALRDTLYLIENGFERVVAVDEQEVVEDFVRESGHDDISVVISRFEDFDYEPGTYDLVNAQYSLPFITPDKFGSTLSKIKGSIKVGGIFVGTFFGPGTEVAGAILHEQSEIDGLFDGFEIIALHRKEGIGKSGIGIEVMWDVYHVIARKLKL